MSAVSEQRQVIAAELADVHTCLPGVIVSYDGQLATVRPTLDKQLANGEVLAAPQIARVPMCWPCGDVNGAKARMTVPLSPGDSVLLHFSERALDDWLNGTDGAPGDPRQFDLSDAFATPQMRPGTFGASDLENLSIEYGPGSIKISPLGAITLQAGPGSIRMDESGQINVVAPGGFLVNGLNQNTHIHTGVESGLDSSGPPVPGT